MKLFLLAVAAAAILIPGNRKMWTIPDAGKKYIHDFAMAEYLNKLPVGLLSRVAWQESRFDPKAKSHAGALGIMQIVPRWHPDVNPLNPVESIYYAAEYLRKLYNQVGTWELALASYNFGIGNVNRVDGDSKDVPVYSDIAMMPRETRDYVLQIGRDISLS